MLQSMGCKESDVTRLLNNTPALVGNICSFSSLFFVSSPLKTGGM